MNKIKLLSFIVLIVLVLVVGCSSKETVVKNSVQSDSAESSTSGFESNETFYDGLDDAAKELDEVE